MHVITKYSYMYMEYIIASLVRKALKRFVANKILLAI